MPAPGPFPFEAPVPAPDGVGESGSMTSGPGVRLAFRLGAGGEVVEAGFHVRGFEDARPVASALCAAMLGATIADLARISVNAVARLGGVDEGSPAARTIFYAKCAALMPFLGRGVYAGTDVVCTCFSITRAAIREAIRAHRCTTVEQLKRHLPASSGCGTCRPDLEELLREVTGGTA